MQFNHVKAVSVGRARVMLSVKLAPWNSFTSPVGFFPLKLWDKRENSGR